ncbi:hypothetical protein SCHPADRAFT_895219 [Schizopora paradoxa]|uniref:F-box domain-containing protein n=1 Tax=Schizopora paradoxa TaxID=27342 RepID=A0A0H2RPH7_9AGAM|nr:hypothetical protein SCHPADRAFT_895219 [Schizopora paradoxa]
MEALERMASKGLHGKPLGKDGETFGFELDSWCRLRTNWSRSDLPPQETSQLFQDANNLDKMIYILKRLKSSATRLRQSVALNSKPMISNLSKGIASLPNEVLMLIFGFMAPAGDRLSRKQAIWLSHVSKRFRSIALGTRSVWTTLDGCASKDELNTFLSRSGKGSDLHLIFYMWAYEPEPAPWTRAFVHWCLPLAPRWASLLVIYEDGEIDHYDGSLFCIFETILANLREYPRLQVMRIQQDCSTTSTNFEPWELAIEKYGKRKQILGLQRIECAEYIPTPDPLYDSAKSFSASISWSDFLRSFRELGSLLPSLQALTVLDLTIGTSSRVAEFGGIEIGCPSVSSLTLHFPSFVFPGAIKDGLLRTFMASFKLPRLTEYSLSIELQLQNGKYKPDLETLFQDLMHSIYPDPSTHPNLATLNIKLSHTKGKTWWEPELFFIPLPRIPYITALTVQTFTPSIKFEGPDRGFEENCALRELRLLECNQFNMMGLVRLVMSLKEVNAWGTIVAFKMESCGQLLGYENAAVIVGEEKLSFS